MRNSPNALKDPSLRLSLTSTKNGEEATNPAEGKGCTDGPFPRVGEEVGTSNRNEGETLGCSVSFGVGLSDGKCEGIELNLRDGGSDGDLEGDDDGKIDGVNDGDKDGVTEGDIDGVTEGDIDGDTDGNEDDIKEGDSVFPDVNCTFTAELKIAFELSLKSAIKVFFSSTKALSNISSISS